MAQAGKREKIGPLFDHFESSRLKVLLNNPAALAERIEPLAGADVRDPLAGFRLERRQDVAHFLRLLAAVIDDLRPS